MNKVLVSPSPHIHADVSTARIMRDVVIALLPSVVVSILYYGWSSVMLLAVSHYLYPCGISHHEIPDEEPVHHQ